MGHLKARKAGRKRVSLSKLLPLPESIAQTISLQNHLALEALCSRHGASLHVTFLFRAVYLTYLLCDTSGPRREVNILRDAEAVLCRCSNRAEEGGLWQLANSEVDALKAVLTLHDGQLQSTPAHHYEAACAHLLNYLVKGGQPVIPASASEALVVEAELAN
jgi:hypothetical protein